MFDLSVCADGPTLKGMRLIAQFLALLILVMPGHCALLTETLGEAMADTELPLDGRECPCGGACSVEGVKDSADESPSFCVAPETPDPLHGLLSVLVDWRHVEPESRSATRRAIVTPKVDSPLSERLCVWTV